MGNCVATVVSGVRFKDASGPGTCEEWQITVAPGSAATDYATGGQPFVIPSDLKGLEFDSLRVIARSPSTREWEWDGSRTAPKLKAFETTVTVASHTHTENTAAVYTQNATTAATVATATAARAEIANATTVNTDTLTCLLRVRR